VTSTKGNSHIGIHVHAQAADAEKSGRDHDENQTGYENGSVLMENDAMDMYPAPFV
jgi:hypothetical protein